jgi:hypothetical protein
MEKRRDINKGKIERITQNETKVPLEASMEKHIK